MAGRAYAGGPDPLAIAHRGGAQLGPENTMRAVERTRALGYTYVELDVRRTRDGVCVAFHDRTLRRVTGRGGRLGALAWADVQRLRVHGAEPVPRIEDFFAAWPNGRWCLDVKEAACLPVLLDTVARFRLTDRVCLAGLPAATLVAACRERRVFPSIAAGWQDVPRLLAVHTHEGAGLLWADFVHVPVSTGLPLLTRRLVARAHDAALRIVIWTVNQSGAMDDLLDRDVDGIITDRPDVLRSVLIRRGEWQHSDDGQGERRLVGAGG